MSQTLPETILGRTGLRVTRLGYGGAHRRPMTEEHADRLLNAVLDAGINFIDTSRSYGNSEELIGKFIGHRRTEFTMATKGGGHPDEIPWTRANLFRGLHESLQRMKTDYIDIMQLHNPSIAQCESGNLVEALEEMRQQGKVRWIAISTKLPDLPTYLEWGVFDAFQIPYSALEREHEGWITKVAQAGAGTIIRGGIAMGEPGVGKGEQMAENWAKFGEAGLDELRQEGESRSAFVLRYTLTHPDTQTIIVGTTNPDHLQENVQAILRGPLPQDVYQETQRRLQAAGVGPTP
ncbi:MAG: aldo/keto reductase [Chloroflexi bacterium]|nr:aldo/keto reductase [Chloroflexota bacterium]